MILSQKDIAQRRTLMKDYPADLKLLDSHEELRWQRDELAFLLSDARADKLVRLVVKEMAEASGKGGA